MRRIVWSLALAGLLIAAAAAPSGALVGDGPPYDSDGGTGDRYTGVLVTSAASDGRVSADRGRGSVLKADLYGVGTTNVEICLSRHGQSACDSVTGAGLHTIEVGPLTDDRAGRVHVRARSKGVAGLGVFQVLRISVAG